MENKTNHTEQTILNISKLEDKITVLKNHYDKFFDISNIFSNENGGKTRLNRQLYNETHEDIQEVIKGINSIINSSLEYLKEELKMLFAKYNQFEKLDLSQFLIDDQNLFELLNISLKNQNLSSDLKNRYTNDIKTIINLKNKIFNIKYFISSFDTVSINKFIDKFSIEELINSSLIFEVIDTYALKYEELLLFEKEVLNFKKSNNKISSLEPINNLLVINKRLVDSYFYADTRYKISLDYDTNLKLKKVINFNLAYFSNIVSNLIEQSCMDIIKKELKKGKIQKFIAVVIGINKNKLEISVKNNGFEVGDIYNLFMLNEENKMVIEVKNLVNEMNGEFFIETKENEGMQYSAVFDLKH